MLDILVTILFCWLFFKALGDGKYGKLDKKYDRNYQPLYSYKLTFTFSNDAEGLNYLNGKNFRVENVAFVEEYFPGTKI